MIHTDNEKMYSPLNFYLRDKDMLEHYDEQNYWRDDFTHGEASDYTDIIELFIRRDRDTLDKRRGMMAYYDEGSVNYKVESLFPAIEEHNGKMWCVAELALHEPLTPKEMAELKNWWSGQLSDGWGEGIEQREIKIDRGDLYMEPWTPGDEFFIDTEREFQKRLWPERLTPDEIETAFINNESDTYAVYRFEGYKDSASAFSRNNYKITETALLTENDTLDTIKAEHALLAGSVIALKQSGEITAWYVDQLAFSKLPDFLADTEHAAEDILSPAQMALNEPGIFDEDIDCVETSAYMSMLTDRVNANYIEYIDGLRGIDGETITDYSAEIATKSEAHYYITTLHNFHFSELDYLLQFKDPLRVIAEAFDANRDELHSDIMWKVFHEQDALKSGRHTLAFDASDEPGVPTAEVLKQELFDRLDKNLSDYRNTMMSNSKQFIYDMAEDIAVKFAAWEYMKTGYDYKTGEVEFLLQFQNPLALVVDNWPSTLDGITDMTAVISGILQDRSSHGHYARVIDETNPAAKESTKGQPGAEKQSVIERIRTAEKESKPPRKEKNTRDKTEPEL